MARRFAPLLTAIWDDDDFCSLTPDAQRMYMQILSQKRLSLCGVVPYAPRNLARGCAALTLDDIHAALDELEAEDYILIDRDTDEILVRTIVKHDPPRGAKVLQGMWTHWSEIDSARFRQLIVHSLSDELWNWKGVTIPESAKDLRNTLSDGVFRAPKPDESEPLSSSYLLPPTPCPLPDASSSQHNSLSDPEHEADDDDFATAIEHIVYARCQGRHIDNQRSYWAAVRREAIDLDGRELRRLLTDGLTPDAAADAVLGRGSPTVVVKAPIPWCDINCVTCDGTAWIDTGNGLAPCPERTVA